jgi:hypothetical protein
LVRSVSPAAALRLLRRLWYPELALHLLRHLWYRQQTEVYGARCPVVVAGERRRSRLRSFASPLFPHRQDEQ